MSIPQLLKAWVLILPAMIANGILRELALKRVTTPMGAELLSALFGIVIIVAITGVLLRPLAGASVPKLLTASAWLVGLTVAFELLFGHYVDGKRWAELAANYEFWNGRPWLAVLATLAFTPFLWGRWSRPATHHAG
jgi:hypothetical protein